MSRSGTKYRDPFNLEARRRKSHPIASQKRRWEEEQRARELDEELQDMWHDDGPQDKELEDEWRVT